MKIIPCGSRPSRRAPANAFTGTVWQDPIIEAEAPGLLKSNLVMFQPGARTAGHTHPMGQTLYVTSGSAGCRAGAGRSRRSAPATSSGSRPARSTGTALGPRRR